ncbi:hypothetical protein AAG906_029257 [Vitis piasezkii]
MPKFPSLRKRLTAVKSMPPRCKKSPLLRKGTVPRGAKPKHPPVCLLHLSKPCASPAIFSSSPSTRLRIPRDAQDSTSEPPRPRLVPPPVKDAPTSPPTRRYNTRRSLTIAGVSSSRGQKLGTGPPKKKAKVS